MKLTDQDILQIEKKGLTVDKVIAQIEVFKKGIPFTNLISAATIGNGILNPDVEEQANYVSFFDTKKSEVSIVKFTPASGAATRMFKFLFQFLDEYNPEIGSINAFINRNKAKELSLFFVGLEKFPFYAEVIEKAKQLYPNFDSLNDSQQKLIFIKTMLDEDKLNFSFYPKGLLPFHKYREHNATAFEEHLFEAALYCASNGKARLHFTISEKHEDKFDEEFQRIEKIVERKKNTQFDIVFSYQKESTDTIAVTKNNEPFRQEDGSLLFRPSGHGALLDNLNDIDADIIFVKNIDNVVVFKYENEVAYYKKMLGGILLSVQEQAFQYAERLELRTVTDTEIAEITNFLKAKLNVVFSSEYDKYSKKYKIEYLMEKLNRPIRVCGMVKNEGEPGGGPFWTKDQADNISLQIVESAQIDKNIRAQKNILKNATHFNPVDIVCGVKNYKGQKYDLHEYVDHNTAFISMKTKTGKDLKALELPGLWNGSMAFWNTIFVEVPLITFNPVKTVNDLLKPAHQVK
ncbi:MAG: DUF4301 family protein [Mangrovimonas sp.]|nr:DUF4301 family protein [Mangrovimonas sp.]MCB0438720.1 DUF4301 family protein [Mangrovimonas sp.]